MTNELINPRIGKFTASSVYLLLKGGGSKDVEFGQMAMKYIREKVAELMTGETISDSQETTSKATEWGLVNEYHAIEEYVKRKGVEVHDRQVFIPYGNDAGCTPDGLVGDDGMIEVKCPWNPSEHTNNILMSDDEFKAYHEDYYPQMQMQLLCSGREWVDFVSYDPRVVEPSMQLYVRRFYRDAEMIDKLRDKIAKAATIRDEMYAEVVRKCGGC